MRKSLGDNARPILAQRPQAHVVINGTAPRDQQVASFSEEYAHHFTITL